MKRIDAIAKLRKRADEVEQDGYSSQLTHEALSLAEWQNDLLREAVAWLQQEEKKHGCYCSEGGPMTGHTRLCAFFEKWLARVEVEE